MNKETLYYVIKYNNSYYAPFMKVLDDTIYQSIDQILSTNRKLAVRFGDIGLANIFLHEDIMARKANNEDGFDPSKCRIVKVVRQIRIIN